MPEGTPRLAETLATVHVGEHVQVERFLSPTIRQECARLGFTEGDTLVCRRSGRRFLWLSSARGRQFALDRDAARYVRVRDVLSDRLA